MTTLAPGPAVLIYPAFDALYYSFYIEGLRQVVGPARLQLSRQGFPDLGSHGLALRVLSSPERRLFISASDGPGLNAAALEWCDLYAKVNLDRRLYSAEDAEKCWAAGPSFPVRAWSPLGAGVAALRSFFSARGLLPSTREHFANYRRQYRYRVPEKELQPGTSEPGFVFFIASLWRNEPETNRLRGRFIASAKTMPGVQFVGGFAPRRGAPVPGFEALTATRRYSISEYVNLTRRSAFVFNTPAVSQCHGWKLGEFLALGKAIISTPLSRELPAPLEHGTHLHLTDGSEVQIREACRKILGDNDYRRRLETHARRYYETYLRPERVIQRFFAAAGLPSAT